MAMATVSYGFWNELLDTVHRKEPGVARAWFRLLKPGVLYGGVLEVHASNPQQLSYLEKSARLVFTQAAQTLTGRLVSIRFSLNGRSDEAADPEPPLEVGSDDWLWRPAPLSPDLTFDEFVVGPCNRFAQAAAIAAATSSGQAYNPFFIYGGQGCGKTHLLHALCHLAVQTAPQRRCVFIRCDQFTTAFLASADAGREHEFRQCFRDVDILAIDDLQTLSGRERSQEELFHSFNALHQRGAQLVLAADRPPRELKGFEDRLTSRFGAGLVTVLDPPCYETRLAILRKKCKLRCLEMPEEVIEFVASRATDSPRQLEGALRDIDGLAQSLGGVVTLEIARQVLGDLPRLCVGLPTVVEVVRRRFGLREDELRGPSRTRALAVPRQIGMYLSRQMTQRSLADIGQYYGGRDHSTVLHGVRLVARRMEESADFGALVGELRHELLTGDVQNAPGFKPEFPA